MIARTAGPALREAPLGLALGFLVTLVATLAADGNLHSPFGWAGCGVTAAAMLRWGVLPGVAAALGAALATVSATGQPAAAALLSHGVMLAGAFALRQLVVALGIRPGLERCTDVARLFVAVSLAMAVPAALTLIAYSTAVGKPTAEWAGLHGLKWGFQATVATLTLLPPLLAFDSGTLGRWRREPRLVPGLLLATIAIAVVMLLRLPDFNWVVLLALPVVAAAAMRVDLAFAGVLALLCLVALMLGVEWAADDDHYALAARVSGLVWSYSMLLSGLMLTVHALRAEHAAVEREIQAARARYRIGMLSTAVREQERIGQALRLELGLELGELAGALQSLDVAAGRHAVEFAEDIAAMQAACQRAIEAAEAVAHGLMPPIDRDGDLARALRELAARVPAGVGLEVRVDCAAGVRLPVQASRDAYRIVQEALNNVLKHAAARQVSITLATSAAGTVEIVVEDDGIGIGGDAGEADGSAGIGLGTMRYRAEHAGGTLRIEPRNGGGTRLVAHIPAGNTAADDRIVLASGRDELGAAAPPDLAPHRGLP